jgi:hypothetical protein
MHPPNPQTNKAAWQGRLVRNPDIQSNTNNAEPVRERQAFRLASKFGFAFETAVTISQLAWGVAR